MASSSRFFKMCLLSMLFFVFFISPSFSSLTVPLPKLVAEKHIRGLNIFPKENYPHFVPGNFTKKNIKFPGVTKEFGHYAGYYSLPRSKAARMFYYFFESRNNKHDPIVIWLQGGPGTGSELALFTENGPFQLTTNLSLVWNEYGWDKVSNILYIDQPIGTGFSYTTDESDIRHDEEGVSNDLYDFLQAFFKQYPQYIKNDFYITGESYGGHYIPSLAYRVHKGNKAKEGIHINLKGFAIGNGLTKPEIQFKAHPDYALDNGLINKDDHDYINKELVPPCEKAIKPCGAKAGDECLPALDKCYVIFNQIIAIAGNISQYDIRKKCFGKSCDDFSYLDKFLNKKRVKEALGVGDFHYSSKSSRVFNAMLKDYMTDSEVGIPSLLEDGIKLLVYAGDKDLICNWLGNSRWVAAMEWSGKKQYGKSPSIPFLVDGKEAGILKSHGPLAFLKVKDAGHLVPTDQPKAAFQMFKDWMQGNLTKSKDNVLHK